MRLDRSDLNAAMVVIGIVTVLGVAITVFSSDGESPHQVISQSTQKVAAPTPTVTAKSNYTEKQKADARLLMNAVKANHKVYEEGPHLVVEMRQYIEDKNALLIFATRVADADCILNNGPRNIYYYDPSMHQVAQADTLNGIRLKD